MSQQPLRGLGFRDPSQAERDAIGVTNSPALTLVAQLAMTYLASCPAADSWPQFNDPHSAAVMEAVDAAYAILREIRRRGEVLDAAAAEPTTNP